MSPAEHLAFLKSRRSRRYYSNADVPLRVVERILEAGSQAPSGANSQPWQFVLIPRGPHRQAIQEMCAVADLHFHETAPKWLKDWLKHHNVSTEKIYFDKAAWLLAVFSQRDLPYWLPSVWLCIANIINQIEAEDLHTVVYTPTLGKPFCELLGVDTSWSCQALLPIGVADPDEHMQPRPRIPAREKTLIFDDEGIATWEEFEAEA